MEEAIVTEEIAQADLAPQSPVKEEPEAVVEEAVVIEEGTEAESVAASPVKKDPEDV